MSDIKGNDIEKALFRNGQWRGYLYAARKEANAQSVQDYEDMGLKEDYVTPTVDIANDAIAEMQKKIRDEASVPLKEYEKYQKYEDPVWENGHLTFRQLAPAKLSYDIAAHEYEDIALSVAEVIGDRKKDIKHYRKNMDEIADVAYKDQYAARHKAPDDFFNASDKVANFIEEKIGNTYLPLLSMDDDSSKFDTMQDLYDSGDIEKINEVITSKDSPIKNVFFDDDVNTWNKVYANYQKASKNYDDYIAKDMQHDRKTNYMLSSVDVPGWIQETFTKDQKEKYHAQEDAISQAQIDISNWRYDRNKAKREADKAYIDMRRKQLRLLAGYTQKKLAEEKLEKYDGIDLHDKIKLNYKGLLLGENEKEFNAWASLLSEEDRAKISPLFYKAKFEAIERENNYQEFLQKRKQNLQDSLEKYADRLAPFAAYRMPENETIGSVQYFTRDAIKTPFDSSVAPKNGEKLYSTISAEDVTNSFTPKASEDNSNLLRGYQYTGVGTLQTNNEIDEAIQNIKDKNGVMGVFDLETTGADMLGDRRVGQRITEYTLATVRGDLSKPGEMYDYPEDKIHSSIIGFSQAEHDKYAALIDKFQKVGWDGLTENEEVTLRRLALTGGEKTKVISKDKNRDLFTFDYFSDREDVGYTTNEMKRGLERMTEIGRKQSRILASGMHGFEEDILAGLTEYAKNGYTVAGYNSKGFDESVLNEWVRSNNGILTDMFKKKVSELTGGNPLSFKYHFDVKAGILGHLNENNRQGFYYDILGKDENKLSKLNEWSKKAGRSQLTQEYVLQALKLAGKYDFEKLKIGGGSAHNATTDAINVAGLVFNSGFFNTEDKNSLINQYGNYKAAPMTLVGGDKQLFYAAQSIDANKAGIVAFVKDPMSGKWRTSDSITIGNHSATTEGFPQRAAKRRVTYSLHSIAKIDQNSKLYEPFVGAHPEMAGEKLVALTFNPVTNLMKRGKANPQAFGQVTWVGTADDISKTMNQFMLHAGDINPATGMYTQDGLSDAEKALFDVFHIDTRGGVSVDSTSPENTIDRLLEDSTYAFQNDTAARVAREKSFKKDYQVREFIDRIDDLAKQNLQDKYDIDKDTRKATLKNGGTSYDIEQALERERENVRDHINQKTTALMQEQANNPGKKLIGKDIKDTYFEYFGYDDYMTGERKLIPNSAANAVTREKYVRKNKNVISESMKYAANIAGLNYDDQGFLVDKNGQRLRGRELNEAFRNLTMQAQYSQAMQTLENEATVRNNGNEYLEYRLDKTAVNYRNRGRIRAEMENLYQVDINGFRGKQKVGGNVVNFDLGVSGVGVSNRIYRHLGITNAKDLKDIDDASRVDMLANFQKFLGGDVNSIYLIDPTKDSVDVAGSKILSMLRERRKANPKAGYITPTTSHDVATATIKDEFFESAEDIRDTLEKHRQTINVVPNKYSYNGKDSKSPYSENSAYKDKIGQLASEVNDKILFSGGFNTDNKEEFIKQARDYGYSAQDAEKLYNIQKLKRTRSQEVVQDIFTRIYDNGGIVGYNEKSGRVWMYNSAADAKAGKNMHELFLPKQIFEKGNFYMQIGESGMKKIDPLVIGVNSVNGESRANLTTIGADAWQKNRGVVDFVLRHNKDKGHLAEDIDYAIGKINSAYSNFSSSIVDDAQDKVMAGSFYVGDVTKAMGQLIETEGFDTILNSNTMAGDVLYDMLAEIGENGGDASIYEKAMKDEGYEISAAFMQNSEIFGSMIAEIMPEGEEKDFFVKYLLPGFSHFRDHTEGKGFFAALLDTNSALENFSEQKNGIEIKRRRAALFSASSDEAHTLLMHGATLGSSIRSDFEQNTIDHYNAGNVLGYSVENTVQVNRLDLTSRDLRIGAAEMDRAGLFGTAEDAVGQLTKNILAGGVTDEGSAYVSSYLADATLTHRFFEQRVGVDKVALAVNKNGNYYNDNEALEGRLGTVSDVIGWDESSGRFTYTSNNGVYVHEDETMFSKSGPFGHAEPVEAKSAGFLRMGFFRDGYRLTDKKVEELLNSGSLQEDLLKVKESASNPLEWKARAFEFIQNQLGLSHDLYVDAIESSGHTKITDLNEKNMGQHLTVGLGQTNAKVAKALTEFKATELIGMEVTADFVSELMNISKNQKNIEDTKFGIVINALRGEDEKLTGEEMKSILARNGFDSVENFGKALYKERHSVTDRLTQNMRKMGWLSENEFVDLIGNNFAGQLKHGDLTNIKSMVMGLQRIGKSADEISDIMVPVLGVGKDGTRNLHVVNGKDLNGNNVKMLRLNGGSVDFDAFNKVADQYFTNGVEDLKKIKNDILLNNENGGLSFSGGDSVHSYTYDNNGQKMTAGIQYITDANGNVLYDDNGNPLIMHKARTEVTQLQNYDIGRASSANSATGKRSSVETNIDERVLSNLNTHEYTESMVGEKARQKLVKVLGEEAGNRIYAEHLGTHAVGDKMGAYTDDALKQGLFFTEGEARIFDSFNSNFSSAEYQRALDRLHEAGMSDNLIDKTVQGMIKSGAEKITVDKVLDFNNARSYALAHEFNRRGKLGSNRKFTREDLLQQGFKEINLDDVSTKPSETFVEGSANKLEGFGNSIYGQQLLVDLNSDKLEKALAGRNVGKIFHNDYDRYLAVPFQQIGRRNPDGSIMGSNVGSKLSSIQRQQENLIEEANQLSDEQITDRISRIRNGINDLRAIISKDATDKNSYLKQASLVHFTNGSSYLTAHGTNYLGNERVGTKNENGNITYHELNLDSSRDNREINGVNLHELETRNQAVRAKRDALLASGKNLREAKALAGDTIDLGYSMVGKHTIENWYNDDYLKHFVGDNEELVSKLKNAIIGEEGVLTKGGKGTLATTLRHPAQRNRSMGAQVIFYDPTLKKDEQLIHVGEMLQKKGDFDSDKLFSNLVKSKAKISIGDQTIVTNQLDKAAYEGLQKIGAKVELLDNNFQGAEDAVWGAAIGYNGKVAPRSQEWNSDALSTAKILKGNTYNGRNSIDFSRSYSMDDIKKNTKNWNTLQQGFSEAFQNGNIKGLSEKDFNDGGRKYLAAMDAYAKNNHKSLGMSVKDADEAMHYHALKNARITMANALTSKEAAGPLNTILYAWQRIGETSGALAAEDKDLLRAGIGAIQEATLTGKSENGETDIKKVQKYRELQREVYSAMRRHKGVGRAADKLVDFTRQIISERADKSEIEGIPNDEWGEGSQVKWWRDLNENYAQKNNGISLEQHVRYNYAKKNGYIKGNNDAELQQAYEDWQKNFTSAQGDDIGKKRIEFEKGVDRQIKTEQVARLQGYMARSIDLSGTSDAAFRLGVSSSGLNVDAELSMIAGDTLLRGDNLMTNAENTINNIGRAFGSDKNIFTEQKAPRPNGASRMSEKAQRAREATQRASSQRSAEENAEMRQAAMKAHGAMGGAIRRVAGAIQNSKGHGLTAALIGIAGGLLTAGYASGPINRREDPPSQAISQAEGASQDEQDISSMEEVPNLSDANMNVMRGGPNSGYIININANTARGQQAATRAIRDSTSALGPQNGSVNISVQNSSSQLEQLQINRMVSNAMGLAY